MPVILGSREENGKGSDKPYKRWTYGSEVKAPEFPMTQASHKVIDFFDSRRISMSRPSKHRRVDGKQADDHKSP